MGVFTRVFRRNVVEADVDLRAPGPQLGRPGDCERCGGGGFLDRIDVVRQLQFQHCRRCDHRWSISFADSELEGSSPPG